MFTMFKQQNKISLTLPKSLVSSLIHHVSVGRRASEASATKLVLLHGSRASEGLYSETGEARPAQGQTHGARLLTHPAPRASPGPASSGPIGLYPRPRVVEVATTCSSSKAGVRFPT